MTPVNGQRYRNGTKNRNEGTFGCSRGTKNRNEATFGCSPVPKKPERGHIRQNHPFTKPPFCLLSKMEPSAKGYGDSLEHPHFRGRSVGHSLGRSDASVRGFAILVLSWYFLISRVGF